jgi:hypothetical protein
MNDRYFGAWVSPLLTFGMGPLVLLAGCQSVNSTATARTEAVCTACQAQTRVMPITGLSYTAHSCPSCRRVSALDETTRAAVERAVGGHVGDTVHTCDRCSISSDCPICRREMG